ncbi:MAG: hypothetical protein P8Z80_06040 [Pseudolabrys sp.]
MSTVLIVLRAAMKCLVTIGGRAGAGLAACARTGAETAKALKKTTAKLSVNASARCSLDDLAKVPQVKKTLTLESFVNIVGGALIFNTPFEGAPL